MVAFSQRKQHGSGVLDTLMKSFTYEKYPGERHAISLAPATFGTPMNFMGPHTRLDLRLNANGTPKPDSQPINRADMASYQHDVSYDKAKRAYDKNPTPENRKRQLQKVWDADSKFIDEMDRDTEEPMAPVAGKLIRYKKNAEQMGILPTTTCEGFGTKEDEEGSENRDPVARRRELVKKQYKNERKQNVKHGGFAHVLILIGVAIASALGSKVVGDLYDYVKKKITGGNYKMNHKTKKGMF